MCGSLRDELQRRNQNASTLRVDNTITMEHRFPCQRFHQSLSLPVEARVCHTIKLRSAGRCEHLCFEQVHGKRVCLLPALRSTEGFKVGRARDSSASFSIVSTLQLYSRRPNVQLLIPSRSTNVWLLPQRTEDSEHRQISITCRGP